jgi:hypothetical protein
MPQQSAAVCVHRWTLGEPNLEGTSGKCRLCGRTTFFPSGLEFEPEANEPENKRDRAAKEARQAAAEWFSVN